MILKSSSYYVVCVLQSIEDGLGSSPPEKDSRWLIPKIKMCSTDVPFPVYSSNLEDTDYSPNTNRALHQKSLARSPFARETQLETMRKVFFS